MPSPNARAKPETATTSITDHLERVDAALNHLGTVLEELEKRMSCVLRAADPQEAPLEGMVPYGNMSPLAQRLASIGDRVTDRRRVVEFLLNRLEL
jgi:hypothetical protein